MSAISIVIPCFNHGRYLPEAIASVRGQTVPVERIVVVDDGSDDPQTIRVLDELADEPDLKVIRQPNAGPAAARNTAIREVESEFVASLDADDRLLPGFVEKLLPHIENQEGVGIVYGEARVSGRDGKVPEVNPYQFPDVLLDPCIYSTAIFRRSDWESVGGYREEMRTGWEDFEFWVSLIEKGREVVFVPEPVFEYRRHESSRDDEFSASNENVLKAFETIFQNHKQIYSENIRILFEAHLERLQWRDRFQGIVKPEIRFQQNGVGRVSSATKWSVSGERVTATFEWTGAFPDDGEFRLDPFDGPGELQVLSVSILGDSGRTRTALNPSQCILSDYSFAVETASNGDSWPTLFFLGRDPHLRFRIEAQDLGSSACGLEMVFLVRAGQSMAPEFLRHLDHAEKDFNEKVERLRGVERELEHVKGELGREMALRRKVQASCGYRWTRPIARFFSRRGASDEK